MVVTFPPNYDQEKSDRGKMIGMVNIVLILCIRAL